MASDDNENELVWFQVLVKVFELAEVQSWLNLESVLIYLLIWVGDGDLGIREAGLHSILDMLSGTEDNYVVTALTDVNVVGDDRFYLLKSLFA